MRSLSSGSVCLDVAKQLVERPPSRPLRTRGPRCWMSVRRTMLSNAAARPWSAAWRTAVDPAAVRRRERRTARAGRRRYAGLVSSQIIRSSTAPVGTATRSASGRSSRCRRFPAATSSVSGFARAAVGEHAADELRLLQRPLQPAAEVEEPPGVRAGHALGDLAGVARRGASAARRSCRACRGSRRGPASGGSLRPSGE